MSKNLFSPIQIGALQLTNRIFMAPLTRARAGPSHVPNDLMKEYYTQRASAGLIITECSMIAPDTSAYIGEPGVYTEEQLKAWKDITDAVHAKGAKIAMQIWHAGRTAHPDNNGGAENVGPSAIAVEGDAHTLQGKKPYAVPRELTVNEIATIVEQFATAAKNAIQVAGLDGVELHGANGYLIDSFLRSSSNTRTDAYGGSIENRTRFLSEVLQAVTDAVGSDKLQLDEGRRPIALSEHVAKISQRFHLAYVHVVRGDMFQIQEGNLLPVFRQHFHNTLIGNLGYTKDEATAAIEAGQVDAVAFGSLFIANPDLPKRFELNADLNTPDPSTFY
ncbi:unnamed protein product, partial [Aphanomyces euteiches]